MYHLFYFYTFYNKSSKGERMHQDLVNQNTQLKVKYKKALHELMHILKINNLLKQNMGKNDSVANVQLREQIEIIKSQHRGQIQKLLLQRKQLMQKINDEIIISQRLQENLKACQIQRNELKKKLASSLSNKKQLSEIESQKSFGQECQNNVNKDQKDPNEQFKNKLLQSLEKQKQILSLQKEITLLKQKGKQLNLEVLSLKQKYRNDILNKDQQNLKRRESDQQKLTAIKCKCNLLQNQLNTYKNSQRYFQFEVKPLLDYQQTLDHMRQQFQKINNDFNRYESDYSKIVVKSEQDDKKAKVLYLQTQNQRLKMQQFRLNKRIQSQQVSLQKLQTLEQKFKALQVQKCELFQKNNILQALLITQKYRDNGNGMLEKIKQFETRIKLMISQNDSIEGYGGYQQITILKGYILQLSQTINRLKKRQQHSHKKNQAYKNQLSEVQINCNQKIEQFNKRIANYEILIDKLYKALQQKIKSNTPEDIEKEFSNAIQRYEEKIIAMSEQIILLRKTNQQLAKGQNKDNSDRKYSRIDELQQQNSTYRKLVDEFKNKVQSLQYEYSSLSSRVTTKINELQKQIGEKNNMIDTLTIENQKIINFNNENFKKMNQKILNYEQQILELQKQGGITNNIQNSQNKYQNGSALANNSDSPQFQLFHRRSISIESITSNNAEDQIKTLNAKIAAQASQIREYKANINELESQLQRYKQNLLLKINQLSAIELQQNVKDMQIQKKQVQSELVKLIQKYKNQEIDWKEDIENLKYQNRGLLEQLSSKQNQLMVYYDQLNKSNNFQEREKQFNQDLRQAHQIIEKSNSQIKELNAQIITLRTNNISLKNQLQSKEDVVNELKHQIFKAELQNQRAKSSGSILKENKNEIQYQTLLILLVITFAQIESLRETNQELNFINGQNAIKYSLEMKKINNEKPEVKDKTQRSRFSKFNHRNTLFENISMQDSIQAPVNEQNEQSESQKFNKNEFLQKKHY